MSAYVLGDENFDAIIKVKTYKFVRNLKPLKEWKTRKKYILAVHDYLEWSRKRDSGTIGPSW